MGGGGGRRCWGIWRGFSPLRVDPGLGSDMSGPAGLRCCCCCCCSDSLTLWNYTTALFTEFKWRHNRWRSTLLLPLTDQINNHQHHGGLLKVRDVTHRAASVRSSRLTGGRVIHTEYSYSHRVLILTLCIYTHTVYFYSAEVDHRRSVWEETLNLTSATTHR